MSTTTKFFTACGLGATMMYWLDPREGRRRRALVRDQFVHLMHETQCLFDRGARDLQHRLTGVRYEAQHLLSDNRADDHTLRERVRSHMGRHVSHPGAIEVITHEGEVTLSGPILAHEADELLSAVRAVRGVKSVTDQLERHEDARRISSLQGRGTLQGEPMTLMQENWSPGIRLLGSGVGAGLMLNCLTRRTPAAILLGTAGFALFLRATTNLSGRRLSGVGAGRQAVSLHRIYHIRAPIERVFEFITDWEESANFMPHVKQVERLDDRRLRWSYELPGMQHLEIDEEITELEPNRLIAWRSLPESPIGYEGRVRFESEGDDQTRIDLMMSYNPPAGALGHVAASLLGRDLKTMVEESFQRIKIFLETGTRPRDARKEPQHS